jgi:two-component system, NtrC family, sensor kinase
MVAPSRPEDISPVLKGDQGAFAGKPSFSIRTRITLGFLICFFVALGITLVSLFSVFHLEDKLRFLKVADNFTFEIQQARRFEKNYFLYGTNLADALSHAQSANTLLQTEALNLQTVVGKEKLNYVANHVRKYITLLENFQLGERQRRGAESPESQALEADLRAHGSEMVSMALNMVQKERQSVDEMLRWARKVPVYFLIFLFFLMFYLAHLLSRQIIGPLTRLLEFTQRIAEGDLTPVLPSRPYRDEFSALREAMNRMLIELSHRQAVLVQSHKLRAVGTLTAGVAHELNNPINNITLTAHMLLEDYKDLPDEERLEMIRDLATQSDRAQAIVRNLLDFARESESKIEPLDLGQLLRETISLAGNQIKLSKTRLDADILPNLPRMHGDRQQLSQVFLNILLNALDVTPQGGRIEISVTSEEPNFLAVKITDNGPGIPDHILPNIFDPFFTTKSKGKGTGLGLSVSQGIVARHGGEIRVASKVGVGTSFAVILPVTTIPAPELTAKVGEPA